MIFEPNIAEKQLWFCAGAGAFYNVVCLVFVLAASVSYTHLYLRKGERELKLLEKKSGKGCCCTTSDDSRQYVESQWSYSTKIYEEEEMTQTDALDEFLLRIHNETFAVSGMIFQDAWNLDLDRLKRCYICERCV